jgi:hypothetical protein
MPGGEKEIIGADLNARTSLRGPKDEFFVLCNLIDGGRKFFAAGAGDRGASSVIVPKSSEQIFL